MRSRQNATFQIGVFDGHRRTPPINEAYGRAFGEPEDLLGSPIPSSTARSSAAASCRASLIARSSGAVGALKASSPSPSASPIGVVGPERANLLVEVLMESAFQDRTQGRTARVYLDLTADLTIVVVTTVPRLRVRW